MMSFYHYYQSASVCCFVVQIRLPTVVWKLTGIAKFTYEKKNCMDSGSIEIMPSCKWLINCLNNICT